MPRYLPDEIEYYINRSHENLREIQGAVDITSLRKAWEAFLTSFQTSLEKLIGFAINDPRSRKWGHKLKHHSTKADEGLAYLREARAAAFHGLGRFGKFSPPEVKIAQGVTFAGSAVV